MENPDELNRIYWKNFKISKSQRKIEKYCLGNSHESRQFKRQDPNT
jgi:hypothetical protein